MTYVLIDLENVMPDDFSRLNREDVRTYLFAGKMQEKIKLATVMAVQPLGDKVKWGQMAGSGKMRSTSIWPSISGSCSRRNG